MGASSEEVSVSRRRYRPLMELGRGGMARVYLAESLASGVRKLVVLKILNSDLASETEMRAAFQREAELSARMNHPNVVQVYEVVEFSGIPVMVMEYVDGIALSRLQQNVRLPLRLHLYALIQVLAGLSHFHHLKDFDGNEYNAVHRDVSPQNVMVLHEGTVKVLDFGIAKVNVAPDQQTRNGMIKGKLHYMPPEQLLGEANIDKRADVFAVGVMLWEAIAGRRMWDNVVEANVIKHLANGELPKLREVVPDVHPELERITERALAPERDERYESAEAMQIDLERALHDLEGHVRPRELMEFMQKHLGERREYQQRLIERALRAPATSVSGIMECVTPPPVELGAASAPLIALHGDNPLMGEDLVRSISSNGGPPSSSSSGTPMPSAGTGVGAFQRPKSRATVALLVGAVALASVATIFVLRGAAPAPISAAAPQAQAMAELRVTAQPATAQILFDGVEVGIGQVTRPLHVGTETSVVEVRAPGYVTERREIRLRGDTSLEVVLRPEAAAATAAAAHGEDGREPSKPASGKTRVPAVRGIKPAAEKAPAPPAVHPAPAPAAAKEGCNPPYKLGADGIKTYKPECF